MTEQNTILNSRKAKKWLHDLLRSGNTKVTFVKKDGTEREMLCTLKENLIPEEMKPKGTGKEKNDDVLAVFDVEKQEWRSFRYDSVKSVGFTIS